MALGVGGGFGDIFELRKSHDHSSGSNGIYARDLRSRSQGVAAAPTHAGGEMLLDL